jgi:uncharacterized oxidoreductase
MNITGRTIFIPGATSGIGLALALALQEAGNTVVVGGRRTHRLDRIAADHPGIGTVAVDTSDPESISAAAKSVVENWPEMDVLVAMAGIMRPEDWTRSGFAAGAEELVTTNLLGPVRLIDAFIDHLLRRPEATVVTVSSGLAFAPLAATPTYNATKAAIHMLSETLRLQWAGTTLSVVELEPPSVATDLMPGHADDPFAMPLADFVAEVMEILGRDPDVREVQVERVKFLRHGEARGDYDQVVATLNRLDAVGG